MLSGTQAIARVLLTQSTLDKRAGLKTAGYVTGYRGSPLGGVDITLWSIEERLRKAEILFVPGVNEDIAATAVRGTQQLESVPDPLYDGVFAAWYGKGPGVDRSGDALKHGNFVGAHRNGGVVVFYGDDHAGKSSSVSHHSEQAMAAAQIPTFYPADVREILLFGQLAYAASRYSGSWIGLKLINEVAEQTTTVDVGPLGIAPILPSHFSLPPEGVHARVGPFNPLRDEEIVCEYRLPLVQAFVQANKIDRVVFRGHTPRLGIITAGKSYNDTRQALELLGLSDRRAASLGISLYKIGCIWPLERRGILSFAGPHEALFVIEEKESFIEAQIASAIINISPQPRLIGKFDEVGATLLPRSAQLEPVQIALAIAARLEKCGVSDSDLAQKVRDLRALTPAANSAIPTIRRSPYFCSGCPHSRSTKIPEGSISMTGIGCHTMANFVRPTEALLPTHMGGEGGNWLGLAPFTGTKHIFQNMGDGTYYHSGLMAIRAAVASGVNITYKILYNDAVAMTGGQPVDGPISVTAIAQQVRHEGVKTIVIVSDNPDPHRQNRELPPGIRVKHRDELDSVQRALRDTPGCSVLIYEQACAAEKRRRRKRGKLPEPKKLLYIAEDVCEGCGDCSIQSTCVSLMPVETDFGTKRKIDQTSCNKDYSCLNGFCPSFVTILGGAPRKPKAIDSDAKLFGDLPPSPIVSSSNCSFNVMIAGIGGTGVVTVAAILGMAAHLERKSVSLYDMTGLAQKGGAVFSHVRIAQDQQHIHSQKLGRGEADVLLAFDVIAALSDEARITLARGRSAALINRDIAPTAEFQFNRDMRTDDTKLRSRLEAIVGAGAVFYVDATELAVDLLGDSIASNLFLVGVASQRGMLPISPAAIERAVKLNGAGVALNINAFRLGRLYVTHPDRIEALRPASTACPKQDLQSLVEHRSAHLVAYQDDRLAARYRKLVEQARLTEQRLIASSETLALTVARVYAKLLAYKDEYEVARLLTSSKLKNDLRSKFLGPVRYELNLAPPILAGEPVNGRPRKRAFNARIMMPFLAILARGKVLRGSWADILGRTAERRAERELISEYEALVQYTLENLTLGNYNAAVVLLGLADMVRGYGPVKAKAIDAYSDALLAARSAFAKGPADRAA